MFANPMTLAQAGRRAGETVAAHNTEAADYHNMANSRPTGSEREADIVSIARQLSHLGDVDAMSHKLFEYEKNSSLDPFAEAFDARLWVHIMSQVSKQSSGQRLSGLSYRDLHVHGFGSDADYQQTVASMPLSWASAVRDMFGSQRKRKVQILNGFDGVLEAGEMLVVLGPPGSGCSTFLKTIAQEMNGIYLDPASKLNYRGITPEQMGGQFRGEAIYTAEVDEHFPKLTVGKTLSFAAEARAPRHPPGGLTQQQYAEHYRNTMMAVFGISHTINTIVGNDFIRGVSGGERKRVTICEAALSGAPLQCWDNSTRGLDSANAIEFVRNLRLSAEYLGTTSAVAIYQAPQSAYDLFDKVSVLYDGEQIYFGKTTEAKRFFVEMGFDCPEQQTTPDFLTSLTSPAERKARPNFENQVPRTPGEFATRWKASEQYQRLLAEIEAFEQKHPVNGERYDEFLASRRMEQSKHVSASSPYTLSYLAQVKLCLRRGFWRLVADPGFTLSQLIGNACMAFIIGSLFYNLEPVTGQFFSRGALIFTAILLNAFGSALEIYTLYAQRGIVDKHARYAFYHRSAEAFASMLTDMPYKISNAILFNTILYFMTNLRREAGPYFFFVLFNFFVTLVMSNIFRSMAALSRTLEQALAPACVIILGLCMFTGFSIPIDYMPGWCRWMNYIDPIAYGFESLMINEFSGREFGCSSIVPAGPAYSDVVGEGRVCSAVGSTPGSLMVSGDAFIEQSYQYTAAHRWRNFGILWAFFIGLGAVYIVATEYISAKRSKGEVLVFPRGKVPHELLATGPADDESQNTPHSAAAEGSKEVAHIPPQTAIFSWKDVVYDIKIKKEPRRILDHVDGWVKPGTLTALMGVSGAGKTTLLDVLATRTTMGVITGEILVDGQQRDASFQRKTGYVQQQDLHLPTSTVREALTFSALLRQPRHVPKREKLEYVDEVLKLLEMDAYADAVVGVPGEGMFRKARFELRKGSTHLRQLSAGLNVEQRKRLTIGVELVAKPGLLLFLDEPTSGLDSQTSWNILQLLRKLTAHGQAILCTIHQPSAILFENFDRLLFLAKGGKTVYFGEVGAGSHILIDYFERNGAFPCPPGENPAEWMLSAIGAAPGTKTHVDWHRTWLDSPERVEVRRHLEELKAVKVPGGLRQNEDAAAYEEFAAPFISQLRVVTERVYQQYWRSPTYIYSKSALCVFSALYIGFVFFNSSTTQQGMQNQMLSIFLLFLIFGQMIGQILPNYVVQRKLYEVRERPSKTFSWKVHVLTSILAEIPWNALMGTLVFLTWFYPIGLYRNAQWTDTTAERGALTWLYVQVFMLFMSTFAQACIAMFDDPEVAAEVANLLIMMCLFFCGILVPGAAMPGFWKFMWRVSPFTYLVEGLLTTGLAGAPASCAQTELLEVVPQGGQTCGTYLAEYMAVAGGYLVDAQATDRCAYCPVDSTDRFLGRLGLSYGTRWRNFGLLWVYIVFNVLIAVGLYWLARVPKNKRREDASSKTEAERDEK